MSKNTRSACLYARGLPAITPLPLAHGETILERAGRFSALFPFAEGYQTRRGHYTPDEISAMGRCLGELHQVLSLYPTPQERPDLLKIDRAAILTKLSGIEQAVAARPQSEERSRVLSLLAQRRAWLLSAEQPASDTFLQLATQLIHGDYQETNLFFQHGKVSAIIDWDQSYVAPRAWEALRTLHYAGQLDADFCRIFLAAYRQVLPLALAELDIAVEIYSWLQAHNLWIYEELYLRGNTRVQTLQELHAQFIPFATRWTNLRRL